MVIQENLNIKIKSAPTMFKIKDICPDTCCKKKQCVITNNFKV